MIIFPVCFASRGLSKKYQQTVVVQAESEKPPAEDPMSALMDLGGCDFCKTWGCLD
jgi:hypothetical protein